MDKQIADLLICDNIHQEDTSVDFLASVTPDTHDEQTMDLVVERAEHLSESLAACAKKRVNRRNAWGDMSYADLIRKAIESSQDRRLTLSQIYDWMIQNVEYFRDRRDKNNSVGWKNSIRHNLSLHDEFIRVQNEGAGRSSWWTVTARKFEKKKSVRKKNTQLLTNEQKKERKRGRKVLKREPVKVNVNASGASHYTLPPVPIMNSGLSLDFHLDSTFFSQIINTPAHVHSSTDQNGTALSSSINPTFRSYGQDASSLYANSPSNYAYGGFDHLQNIGAFPMSHFISQYLLHGEENRQMGEMHQSSSDALSTTDAVTFDSTNNASYVTTMSMEDPQQSQHGSILDQMFTAVNSEVPLNGGVAIRHSTLCGDCQDGIEPAAQEHTNPAVLYDYHQPNMTLSHPQYVQTFHLAGNGEYSPSTTNGNYNVLPNHDPNGLQFDL
ncbi:hypothetical protein ACOME3_008746 [Neoechinorhynchus agilis]